MKTLCTRLQYLTHQPLHCNPNVPPPDIRNFFTPSAGPRKSKLASRFFNGGASVLSTPSTAAPTPPPCLVLVADSTSTSIPSSQDFDSRLSASSTYTVEADPLEHPTPPKLSALRSRRALGEPAVIGTSSGTGATATATANQVHVTRVTREGDKENARRAMAAPSGSGAATAVAELNSTRSSSRVMSDFFLVGPTPAPRSGGHGRAEAGRDSRHVPNQNRFALPTGKSVLGRNSVRDSFPNNRYKIRIGIDAREEVKNSDLRGVLGKRTGRWLTLARGESCHVTNEVGIPLCLTCPPLKQS